jgi:hypothetical protein
MAILARLTIPLGDGEGDFESFGAAHA